MRLSFITLILSCLSLTLSVYSKPQFLSRRDRNRSLPDVLSSRQYRFPRDILDICVNADVDLLANAGQLLSLESILGALGISTKIHLCLCLKDLQIYLKTDNDIKALIGLLGPDVVEALVRGVINTSPDAQKCTFPPHAHRTCNTKDPCHWACDDHYVRNDDTCVCAPPYVSCNGECGLFPLGCSSALPRSLKTRAQPILALPQAQATCKPHESVCGIDRVEASLAFECIDTTSTKDSCGGCMVKHPFPEVEPVHHTYGQDCTRTSNAHFVSCAKSRCIVHSCKVGWVPDSNRSECIIDPSISSGIRRAWKRSGLVSANVTVYSDILTNLITIVNIVLDVDAYTPDLSASSLSSTTTHVLSLLNDINVATAELIGSPTVDSLLRHIDQLLDMNSQLKSLLTTCGCVDDLNLSKLVEELEALVTALADLRTFCSHHTVVSGPGPSPSAPEQPIIIPLSSLLAGLGLKGKSIVAISGLLSGSVIGSTNNLLDALGLGTHGHHGIAAPSTKNSGLLAKLTVLVQLVVKLQEDSASLPLISSQHGSSISSDLITPLVKATANVLNSTTVSSLVASVNEVVGLSVASLQALDRCACVDKLGLKQLYQDLKSILDVASDAQSWCLDRLPSSADDEVILALNQLSASLGLGVEAVVTVGLGHGLSDPVNNLLDSVGIGPNGLRRREKRQIGIPADSNTVDSTLQTDVYALIDLVLELVDACGPSDCSHLGTLPNFVSKILNATAETLTSKSWVKFVDGVNHLVTASSDAVKVLDRCGCVRSGRLEEVYGYTCRIRDVAVALQDLCRKMGLGKAYGKAGQPIVMGLTKLLSGLGI